jgi:nucleotide-binding universal stress UspA family protein
MPIMFRRHHTVLVPTDFSPGAAAALDRAVGLPLPGGARIVLLHVLPVATAQQGEAERVARDALAAAAARATPPGVTISSEIASGDPFEQIIARARVLGASLIVIGRHGRRAIRDLFIGSTAERTIRYGDVPVLVVNRTPEGAYARPVVAVDLQDTSPRVVELASSVIAPETELIVVHGYRIPYEGLPYGGPQADLIHQLESQATDQMATLVAASAGARLRPVVRRGDARSVILAEILLQDADLVVLGTHGRTGLAKVLVGSVAEWVIAAARCDVLVTRPTPFSFSLT